MKNSGKADLGLKSDDGLPGKADVGLRGLQRICLVS